MSPSRMPRAAAAFGCISKIGSGFFERSTSTWRSSEWKNSGVRAPELMMSGYFSARSGRAFFWKRGSS